MGTVEDDQELWDRLGQGDTEAFGLALFHGFAFPFEVTSLLIIVAVLGAMVLGRKA